MRFDTYKRACTRALETRGIEVLADYPNASRAADVVAYGYGPDDSKDPKVKYEIWIAESLLLGFRAVERNDYRLAFRAYNQAREYMGRLDGFDPLAYCDATRALHAALEAKLA